MFDLIARVVAAGEAKLAESPMHGGFTPGDKWPDEAFAKVPVVSIEPEPDGFQYRVSVPGYSSLTYASRIHGSEWSPPGTANARRYRAGHYGGFPTIDAAIAVAKRGLTGDAKYRGDKTTSVNIVDRVGYRVVATVTRKLVEAFDVEVSA